MLTAGLAALTVANVLAQLAPPEAPPAPPAPAAVECFPQCRSGYLCHQGQCISACNPPCATGEVCSSTGDCESAAPQATLESVPPQAQPPASEPAEGHDVSSICRPPCGADDTCVNGRCVREGSEGGSGSERVPPPGSRYSAASESGFSVGLRVGYATPLGKRSSGVTMSDSYSSLVPFVLDLGYHFTPNIYLGFLGDFGILTLTDRACPPPAECSGIAGRVGPNLQYRFNPLGPIDPWVGMGVGFEFLSQTVSVGGVDQDYTVTGLEFVNFQFGLDVMATPALRIGPYMRVPVAQYSSSRTGSGGEAADIENKALHSWLEIGLRVAFDI